MSLGCLIRQGGLARVWGLEFTAEGSGCLSPALSEHETAEEKVNRPCDPKAPCIPEYVFRASGLQGVWRGRVVATMVVHRSAV